jgi:hypothetical protein
LLQGDVRGSRTGVWNEGGRSLVVTDGLTSFVALVTESLVLMAVSQDIAVHAVALRLTLLNEGRSPGQDVEPHLGIVSDYSNEVGG